ncbi:hypothetical protein GCM10027039_19700 [Terrabacter koreensis]
MSAAGVLSLAMLAAACSIGTTDSRTVGLDPSWTGPSPLLTKDDLPLGYSNDASADEEDLTEAGCLSAVTSLASTATDRRTATLTTPNPFNSSIVKHSVLTFAGDTEASAALGTWLRAARQCSRVEVPTMDENLSTLRLTVRNDTVRHGDAVVAEGNLIATGKVDSEHIDVDISQWISVAQVRHHLSVVQVLDFNGEDAVENGQRLAGLTAERVAGWATKHGSEDVNP